MTMESDNDKVKKKLDELDALVRGLIVENKALRVDMPRTSEDVEALLAEFVAAEDDSVEHHRRFPNVREVCAEGFHEGYGFAADPKACQEDWRRCCARVSTAKSVLLAYLRQVAKARAERKVA
jgi:hypothetical protein